VVAGVPGAAIVEVGRQAVRTLTNDVADEKAT